MKIVNAIKLKAAAGLVQLQELAAFLKEEIPASRWTPIRKIAASGITAVILWGAKKLDIDLGDSSAAEAANYVLIVLVGYLVPASKD